MKEIYTAFDINWKCATSEELIGVDVTECSLPLGDTALHYAVRCNGRVSVIKLLIEMGSDVNFVNENQCTPLVLAIMYKAKLSIIKTLIKCGADLNKRCFDGCSALHWATQKRKDSEILLDFLVKNGADINIQDCKGNTPIFYAIRFANESAVRFLLNLGATVNYQGEGSGTALHEASNMRIYTIASYSLVMWGGELYRLDRGFEQPGIVKTLLDHGALLEQRNDLGMTPLHCAAFSNSPITAGMLIIAGADVNARDSIDYRPIDWASKSLDSVYGKIRTHTSDILEIKRNNKEF